VNTECIGVVVLNYENFQETISCVDSVIKQQRSIPIVVVDNQSPNNSFVLLIRHFSGNTNVTVLQAGRNGGYSAGNNIGIRAFRKRGINNVIIATSDTRLESVDLIERCLAARDAGIAVVGPYVRSDKPGSDNPVMFRLSLQYIFAIHLGKLWTLAKQAAQLNFMKPRAADTSMPSDVTDVYMVHGCFLFLSEHYLFAFGELDEDLFMYGEEDLISFNCIRRGLRVIYDPRMVVYHGDAKSTSPGEFRIRAISASMTTLKRKMHFWSLINAYLNSH
jgi:GT2 family glycosyltransferase